MNEHKFFSLSAGGEGRGEVGDRRPSSSICGFHSLGAWLEYEPDPVAVMLGTGFDRFRSACGIVGLAKESAGRFDVLAVTATQPGTGQFREFVQKVCGVFDVVSFWEVWNPDLATALRRYGFRPVTFRWQDEKVRAWQWRVAPASRGD